MAQYEVVAKLGGGGMGIVYAARDTKLGRRVALKFLPPRWSHDDSAKQRFMREAQAASATDHRNICTIHDIGTADDGQLFIVMAHYDGQTLKQRLEAGPLPVDDAVEIAAQVAEGLARAHGQGVVHRDIKPGNLILTEDGVKIVDFGLAKLAAESLRLTLEGSTIGTVAYMSPEQSRGDDADARSDIWAVGVVLYEMLCGVPPFRGSYAEAISHAIRNDVPAPLRTPQRDIPPALDELVVRVLTKNADQRVQTARDLARQLRMLQGRTLPIDLRTESLAPLPGADPPRAASRRWTGRRAAAVAAAVIALAVGAPLWIFAPIDRMPVAIAPVVNQTGYAELDGYRLALTQTLIGELSDARGVRVLPYERLLQIVRRFAAPGSDVSSRDATRALTLQGGARTVVVPTILNENGGWKARVEFRDASTATTTAAFETPVVVSSLMKDAVYGLMAPLAAGIEEHFAMQGPARVYLATRVRTATGRAAPPARPAFGGLDAQAAFAAGIDAYEQQEYAAALRAFSSAAQLDERSPLARAWRSRTARVMRRDNESAEGAQAAVGLLAEGTPAAERLFVEAVAAESRRDLAAAEARYRELAARAPDEPSWLMELAAFHDRQGRAADAMTSLHAALGLDAGLARPHLDLCRLYNPNELAVAKDHGQRALTGYRGLGARAGEAQALWCLADILRLGNEQEATEARRHADAALAIFDQLDYPYNLSRAQNYVALAAVGQGRFAEAVAIWEKALVAAREVGNTGLQPLMLMNIGVMEVRLGNRSRAVDYYQQSAKGFEALGQEQRAAELQANAAGILIENGGNPEQGLRDVQNALAVARKIGNRNFEVLAAQLTAAYHRYAGRHGEAERELNRALALARERDLKDDIPSLTTDLARSRMELGDYDAARTLLADAVAAPSGTARTHARIRLGQTYVRLKDFDAAQRELALAEADLNRGADPELMPVLDVATGELAYERGRHEEARSRFSRAAAAWTDTLPDAASVEARAYLGLLDGLEGRFSRGVEQLQASLDQARRMGRFSLDSRIRVFLAQLAVRQRRFDDALRTLDAIPPDDAERTIGPALRAQVEQWRRAAMARTSL